MGTQSVPTTQIISIRNQIKAAKEEHLDAVAPDRQAAFKNAISTKNPLALSTFEERGASIEAKLDRIRTNPNFQKLSPEQQAKVRGNMYDKYVKPSYAEFHLSVPPKEVWVKLTERNGTLGNRTDANSYFDSKTMQAGTSGVIGADQALTGIAMFGAKVSNKIFQYLHGMDNVFSAHLPQDFLPKQMRSQLSLSDVVVGNNHHETSIDRMYQGIEKAHQHFINAQKEHIDGENVWLQTHYRDSTLNSLSKMSGEFIATLPLYTAVGANLGAAGKAVGLEGTAFGPLVKGASLTAKLSRNPIGKWVYGTLKAATDGYTSALITSGGNKADAKGGAITGGFLHGAGGPLVNKIASYPLIKKWTASVLAMGGKPFAQDLATSAMHENVGLITHVEEYSTSPNANEMHVGNGITIKHKTEGKGYISFNGVDHPYTSKEEQQALYSRIEKMAESKRLLEDPINAELHRAEKLTQGSIAMQLYNKPLRNLSKPQRARVFSQRLKLIDQAAEEAPVHLPEMVKAEAQHSLDDELATNPTRAARHKQMERDFGGSVADLVAENTIKAVSTETGIRNSKVVLNKIAGSKQAASKALKDKLAAQGIGLDSEYEPKDGATAFYDVRRESVAYLRDPSRGKNRLAADGTKVGGRDKRSWNEILKSDNLKDFVDVLKEADGGRIKFENDFHRMLYHYSNREGLDAPLKNKLLREMKKVEPTWSTEEFKTAADNTALHLYEMAKGGQLVGEGNMFASTNIDPEWSPTQWQMQLHNDNDNAQLEVIKDALKRHPKALQSAMASVQPLIDAKYQTGNINDYLALDEQIRTIARDSMMQARRSK